MQYYAFRQRTDNPITFDGHEYQRQKDGEYKPGYGPDEDLDGDGLSNKIEYKICVNPLKYGMKIIDCDYETVDHYGLANPEVADIFLEIDLMNGVNKPTEEIVKAATNFAEKDIRLHIDDGCLGDGGIIGAIPSSNRTFGNRSCQRCFWHQP